MNRIHFSFALILSSIFFLCNYLLLQKGHLHEDAYILFVYVENLVNGYGISYYPGGPNTEGATDFLWLMLLSLLVKLGLNVATSAILLNSLGVFIITFLMSIEVLKSKRNVLMWVVPFIFFWLFSQSFIAAIGGFSVILYMSIILIGFISLHKNKNILITPYISIVIALFRPEGVIIGVGFVLIGLYFAYKQEKLNSYIRRSVFVLLVGIGYFIWRYNYFGELLPLPIYVKSGGRLFAGLEMNINWLIRNIHIIIPLLFLAIINKKTRYYTFLASPIIILFIMLFTVTQSQNVGNRFQAPVFIIFYYILVVLMVEYLSRIRRGNIVNIFVGLYILLFVFLSIRYVRIGINDVTRFNYINQFSYELNKMLPEGSIIALTEAGRLAYWNQSGHKIIDLVGLNTSYPAKNEISSEYIEEISPDVIMYYDKINNIASLIDTNHNVIRLPNDGFKLLGRNQADFKFSIRSYIKDHSTEYDIFLVDYMQDKTYYHIYAFRRDLLLTEKLDALLKKSFDLSTHASYFDMKFR